MIDLALRREGFDTRTATTAAEGLRIAAEVRPALILLDLMLPDRSGIEVCRLLRADPATASIPIIMLTAKGDEVDRVVGFEVGADDYVVKASLSLRELALRVRAVLRRSAGQDPALVPEVGATAGLREMGALLVDVGAHRAWVDGEEVPLTATEFRLLLALVDRPGRVQTRGSLLEAVWDAPPDLNTRTVDTHVKRLREKLGVAKGSIETVRGVGYRFHLGGA